jgi:hypothetical protein
VASASGVNTMALTSRLVKNSALTCYYLSVYFICDGEELHFWFTQTLIHIVLVEPLAKPVILELLDHFLFLQTGWNFTYFFFKSHNQLKNNITLAAGLL